MEPTLALLIRLVDACGLELRLTLAEPLGSSSRNPLGVEERLRENDRLSALRLMGQRHRGA